MRIRDRCKRIGRLPADRGRSMRERYSIGGTGPIRACGNTVFLTSNGMGKESAAERSFCGDASVSLCGSLEPTKVSGKKKNKKEKEVMGLIREKC